MRDQEGGENLDKTREQDLQQKTHKGTEKKGHSVDTNIKRKSRLAHVPETGSGGLRSLGKAPVMSTPT